MVAIKVMSQTVRAAVMKYHRMEGLVNDTHLFLTVLQMKSGTVVLADAVSNKNTPPDS